MDQKTLMAFMHRIITASNDGNQAVMALSELESILKMQGISKEDLALIQSAREGLTDSGRTMKSAVASSPVLSLDALRVAVTRAHEQKLRDEEAARNGRC